MVITTNVGENTGKCGAADSVTVSWRRGAGGGGGTCNLLPRAERSDIIQLTFCCNKQCFVFF